VIGEIGEKIEAFENELNWETDFVSSFKRTLELARPA
jgi:hypothetical protein